MSTTLTFGQPDIKHPYKEYRLSDAVQMAVGLASIRRREPVTSLQLAREVVQDELSVCGFSWITGYVAMDILDAAIDGRDLHNDSRLLA